MKKVSDKKAEGKKIENIKGREMNEEEVLEWKQAFETIEECIEALYGQDEKQSN